MRSLIIIATMMTATMATAAEARKHLRIVSSPGDFPFTSKVGESFARGYQQPVPVIQRSGARTSVRLFCAGVGVSHPDIISLPRAMQAGEVEECRRNGVRRITQIKVGYEAVVLAQQRGAFRFDVSRLHLFKALAKEVPIHGKIVANPYENWSDIDPYLPPIPIRVIGPRADSDLRRALLTMVMDDACRSLPEIAKLGADRQIEICTSFRNDKAFKTISRDYDDAVRLVGQDPSRMILMPFAVYEKWDNVLSSVRIDGSEPTVQTISDSSYPVTCPLFVYVKTQHYDRVPGILEFVTEYTSDRAWGPEGYLTEYGLIPLSETERRSERANAIGLSPMKR